MYGATLPTNLHAMETAAPSLSQCDCSRMIHKEFTRSEKKKTQDIHLHLTSEQKLLKMKITIVGALGSVSKDLMKRDRNNITK